VVSHPGREAGSDAGTGAGADDAGTGAGADVVAHSEGDEGVRPCVVLIGPPGSGKTTVGHLLATLLGVELRDTDRAIEIQQGRSVSDIFLDDGEPRFRELERAEVLSSLASHRGVLSLGGGAVVEPVTAAALSGHTVVFLDVGIADAATRVGFNQSRPLLAVNPRAQWTRMMEIRRPTYERLATFTVLTAGRGPHAVASEIGQQLERLDDSGLGAADRETDRTGERRE
jgi:shikimate kinase